jgi:hypothetical protein
MPNDVPPKDITPQPRFFQLPAGSFLWRVTKQPGPTAGGPRSPFRTLPDEASYDERKSGRFDPTLECEYSYCYAALDDLTALCEVLLRDVGFTAPSRYLPKAEIASRRLALLETTKPLWLVSLADAADLAAVCQDSWLIHTGQADYRMTRRWAHWLRGSAAPDGHPPAGLMWPAKREPGGRAVLLFGDRCGDTVVCSSFGERLLDDEAGMKWLNLRLELLYTRVGP